ncbi:hypothetical protein A2U01_0071506, partial [Trifolium medium]|nr:hypothetical protein [Trifolium medium]
SKGAIKPDAATLEIEANTRETRTKASHDRAKAPAKVTTPSKTSNPRE